MCLAVQSPAAPDAVSGVNAVYVNGGHIGGYQDVYSQKGKRNAQMLRSHYIADSYTGFRRSRSVLRPLIAAALIWPGK